VVRDDANHRLLRKELADGIDNGLDLYAECRGAYDAHSEDHEFGVCSGSAYDYDTITDLAVDSFYFPVGQLGAKRARERLPQRRGSVSRHRRVRSSGAATERRRMDGTCWTRHVGRTRRPVGVYGTKVDRRCAQLSRRVRRRANVSDESRVEADTRISRGYDVILRFCPKTQHEQYAPSGGTKIEAQTSRRKVARHKDEHDGHRTASTGSGRDRSESGRGDVGRATRPSRGRIELAPEYCR
jgi:hypothetical protein